MNDLTPLHQRNVYKNDASFDLVDSRQYEYISQDSSDRLVFFHAIKNSGGGNCLFLALCHCMLRIDAGLINPLRQAEFNEIVSILQSNVTYKYYDAFMRLRSVIGDELLVMYDFEAFPGEYCELAIESKRNLEHHIARIKRPGECGILDDAVAFGHRYGIQFCFICDNVSNNEHVVYSYCPILDDFREAPTLYLRNSNNNHFECLVPDELNNMRCSSQSLQEESTFKQLADTHKRKKLIIQSKHKSLKIDNGQYQNYNDQMRRKAKAIIVEGKRHKTFASSDMLRTRKKQNGKESKNIIVSLTYLLKRSDTKQ